jgi:CYTH domain-containing protein
MSLEIERKFLLEGEGWRGLAPGQLYRQGYLSTVAERTVRVRIAGEKAMLTIKGKTVGVSRLELEYPIPLADAEHLLAICEQPLIEKTRYRIKHAEMIWEVDEFFGSNKGLLLAEIELSSEDQPFESPPWIGQEISGDPRYYNANLIAHPFTDW